LADDLLARLGIFFIQHHGIVFQPEERKVWVSTNPYQMGEFVAYDLDEVFEKMKTQKEEVVIASEVFNVPEDPFIHTKTYANYETFRVLSRKIESATENEEKVSKKELIQFQNLNPNYWATYFILGEYHYTQKSYKKAVIAFKQAQKREVTTAPDVKQIEKYIKKCQRKM